MIDRTNEIIINQRAKKLYLSLNETTASQAIRQSGYASYPNSLSIIKTFIKEGYYTLENRRHKLTTKGLELKRKLEEMM